MFPQSTIKFLFTLQIDVKLQPLRLSGMYKTFVQLENEWGKRASSDVQMGAHWSAVKQNTWCQELGMCSP